VYSRLERRSRDRVLDADRHVHAVPQQLDLTLVCEVQVTAAERGAPDLPQPVDDSLRHQVRYTTGTVLMVVGVAIVAGAVVLNAAPCVAARNSGAFGNALYPTAAATSVVATLGITVAANTSDTYRNPFGAVAYVAVTGVARTNVNAPEALTTPAPELVDCDRSAGTARPE